MNHKTILAIDPGPGLSGYIFLKDRHILAAAKTSNSIVFETIRMCDYDFLTIEMPACYGMPVGKSVFDTCVIIGHMQRIAINAGKDYKRIYRKQKNELIGAESVCMHLCKSNRAKDSNIRQAIIDIYPATGGGKIPQIGTKKQPGPLYGIKGDMWAALAVALTFQGSDWYKRICR